MLKMCIALLPEKSQWLTKTMFIDLNRRCHGRLRRLIARRNQLEVWIVVSVAIFRDCTPAVLEQLPIQLAAFGRARIVESPQSYPRIHDIAEPRRSSHQTQVGALVQRILIV